MSHLLGLCGSLRRDSFNLKLMREAALHYGGPFVEGNLRLPLYDGDLEEAEGIPADVQTLADQIKTASAVLVVTPEYNKSLSGVLKNALDWVSRTKDAPWAGKPVAILSATAGRSGGERAQYATRLCLMPFQAHVLPGPEVLIGSNFNEFTEEGRLKEGRGLDGLKRLMDALRAAAT